MFGGLSSLSGKLIRSSLFGFANNNYISSIINNGIVSFFAFSITHELFLVEFEFAHREGFKIR